METEQTRKILDEILETQFMKTWIQKYYKNQPNPRKLIDAGLYEFIYESWEVLQNAPSFMEELVRRVKLALTSVVNSLSAEKISSMVKTTLDSEEIVIRLTVSGILFALRTQLLTALNTKTDDELRDIVLKARGE